MTTKFTPGPWVTFDPETGRDDPDGLSVATPGPDGTCICDVEPGSSPGETHANARLIAAAPELLDALRELTKFLFDNGYCPPGLAQRMEAADAAITKATGLE